MAMRELLLSMCSLLFIATAHAQTTPPVQLVNSERTALPGSVEYRCPAGTKGFYKHGCRRLNDSALD